MSSNKKKIHWLNNERLELIDDKCYIIENRYKNPIF